MTLEAAAELVRVAVAHEREQFRRQLENLISWLDGIEQYEAQRRLSGETRRWEAEPK